MSQHLGHLDGMSAGGTAFLVTTLALLPAIALGLLVLTVIPRQGS